MSFEWQRILTPMADTKPTRNYSQFERRFQPEFLAWVQNLAQKEHCSHIQEIVLVIQRLSKSRNFATGCYFSGIIE